jgi:hypothetical protein
MVGKLNAVWLSTANVQWDSFDMPGRSTSALHHQWLKIRLKCQQLTEKEQHP